MALVQDIQAAADAAGLEIGLAARQLETGEQVTINGDRFFPMASVFKIPILATAGQQLVDGKLRLDDRVTLSDDTKSAGSGILPFFQSGLNPTVRDLLTLMIIISDNTATDMTINLLGGPAVIEANMHRLGLNDIYFSMNCKSLLKTLFPPEVRDLPLAEIKAWADKNDVLRDSVAFSRERDNNVSTPLAMTALVSRLFQGEIVAGEVKDELIGILFKQQLNARLPRFLPSHVAFAHKTGTIGGFWNDSGVIVLGDHNHVALTLFTSWDDHAVWNDPIARQERVHEVETAMGKIGRLVYDHFSNSGSH